MRIMLWTASLACLALWSLLIWQASGLVSKETLGPPSTNAPLAEAFAAESWLIKLNLISQAALSLLWVVVSAILWLGTAVLNSAIRTAGRRGQTRISSRHYRPPRPDP